MRMLSNLLTAAVLLTATAAPAQTVKKLAEGFEYGGWGPAQYNTAAGSVSCVNQPAPGVPSTRSLLIEPSFTGAFGGFGAEPAQPLLIPGDAKSITLRFKVSDTRYGLRVSFRDGWGREGVAGKPLQWDVKNSPTGDWQESTFAIPADWVRPIAIARLGTHNWNAQSEKNKVQILVDHIEAETDLKNVDAAGVLTTWRPEPNPADPAKALKQAPRVELVRVAVTTPEPGNVFAGVAPTASVLIQNWKEGELAAGLKWRVLDQQGQVVTAKEQALRVASIAGLDLPLPVKRFGLYRLEAEVTLADGAVRTQKLAFAHLPAPRTLTEAQKMASPYGLNYHGGGRLLIQPFRRAGLIWFREYAFTYDWLLRARGEDGKYAGWPGYPRIVQTYFDADAKVLPCLAGSIKPPSVENGKVVGDFGPDNQWTRNMAHVILAFPQITHWELANEYDLPKENAAAENLVNWANYQRYHARLGELTRVLGGGKLTAVENGRAGIWPDLERACVQSGQFNDIGVVNSHHYCGTDAPEENLTNFNTPTQDQGGKPPALFFDELRAVTRAGRVDGKPRQHWLTEFGWDTLAGPVVSPYEQAVYLPRAWMLALAAGCDKAFWFYHFDSENPKQFFDGCGLLTYDAQPKLALAALAGLTSVLPSPRYVGMVSAGPGTAGYVFEQDGKLVAALFSVATDDGPTVKLAAERLFDYLGNPLEGTSVKLSRAPTYAVGLDAGDALHRQTAYGLDTPYLVVAAAGDAVEPVVLVENNRQAPLSCAVKAVLPAGWRATTDTGSATVAPGQKQALPLAFSVGPDETLGMKEVKLEISEGALVKTIALKVLVQPGVVMSVSPLVGRPGDTELTIKLGNRTRRPVSGALALTVPAGWKAAAGAIAVSDLKPGEFRAVKTPLTWTAQWTERERAAATFTVEGGARVTQPIIPNQFVLHRAGDIQLDGKLDDWPANTEFPAWMLGATAGVPDARLHLAWAPAGIYGALEVHDSKLQVSDPRSFWAGDVLELFLDTADDKRDRFFEPGDHQFWLVPQPAENRVYAGRWKSKAEIPATLYDLPHIRGAVRPTADGYIMEFLLPAEHLEKYQPRVGARLGLNVNLTVQGRKITREVFWPRAKEWAVNNQPKNWGSVELRD